MSNTYYGEFGGQFVSESLMNTLAELEKAFDEILANQLHYVVCTLTMLEQRRRVAEFCRKHNIRAVFLGAGAVGMGFPTFA